MYWSELYSMIIVLAVYLKITDQCRDRHLVSVFQNNAPLG